MCATPHQPHARVSQPNPISLDVHFVILFFFKAKNELPVIKHTHSRAPERLKRLKRENLRDRLSVRGREFKGISDRKEILEEIVLFLLAHRSG